MSSSRKQGHRVGLLAGAAIVFAAVGQTIANAQEAQLVTVSVHSQDLGGALNQLARQTNSQIVFRPELVRGKRTQALSGALTTEQALERLLSGTGLTFGSSSARAYTIQAQAPVVRPTQAGAADRAAPAAIEASAAEEVVITGSRITRPGYTAPTPVTSVSTADLMARAPGNLTELQRDIPALSINENTNGNRGIPGSSNPNLRGLGASRTLVLLDGQRLPPSTPQGAVDISAIPTALISRIDLVTGGASAAYGSDAVAGVMSIFLDTKLEGVKATGQVGQASAGDYQNYLLSSAFGTSFAGGKGHLIAAAEWYENLGALYMGSRDWSRDRWQIVPNTAYTVGNTTGQTRLILARDVSLANATDGGVIVGVNATGPLKGIQFGPGGTVLPFQYGQYWSNTSTFQIGPGASFSEFANLTAYQQRYGGLVNGEYELTDNTSAFANVMWMKRSGSQTSIPNYNSAGALAVTINRDNPFIPKAVADILAANPSITRFTMGRTNLDLLNPDSGPSARSVTVSSQEQSRAIGGLKGEFGGGWSWDTSVQYGKTDFALDFLNDRIEANWAKAVDAVLNPATGQPACRVNVDAITSNDDPACVPANLFGPNAVSIAVGKYALATSKTWGSYKRLGAAANLQGELFELPAGPVAIAAGAEIRKDEMEFDADPISRALGYRTNNQGYSQGEYTVWEAYGETDVPIVSGAPLAEDLSINGAVRYTHYSTSGGVTTWKVGANYKPVDDLRFRGVVSRDIRAPSLYELFAGRSSTVSSVNDSFTGTNTPISNVTGGNPTLIPEEGTTYSAGFVFQPRGVSGLQISLDYYKLKLEGAIESTTIQNTVNFCFAGVAAYCSQITRNAANTILSINTTPLNTGSTELYGWDFDTVYSLDFAGGDLSLHGVLNYNPSRLVTSSGITIQTAGSIGVPEWRGNGSVSWRNDKWNLLGQVLYIGGGVRDATYVDGVDIAAADNHIDGLWYTNVSAGYELREGIQIFGKIDNLFDIDPPITPSTTIGQQQASGTPFDTIGRRWVTGVRLNF